MLYILLLLGAIAFLTLRLNAALPKKNFNWFTFIKKNIPAFALSIITGVIIILSKDDLVAIYPVTKITIAVWGYAGSEFWQKLVDSFDPTKKTVLGN